MSEIFDIFDENNNPTGETATREECHDPEKRLIHRDIHIIIKKALVKEKFSLGSRIALEEYIKYTNA